MDKRTKSIVFYYSTQNHTVFLGCPIWWGGSAWPVDSFVKQVDFGNKTVIPFCTSHSSGLDTSDTGLKAEATDGNWQPGHRFSQDATDKETVMLVDKWRDQAALDTHHKTPMMEEIAVLREKCNLHMRVEKYMDISHDNITKLTKEEKDESNFWTR